MVLVPHCRMNPRAVKGVALRVRARDIVREKEATVTRRRHGLRARPHARLLASALGRYAARASPVTARTTETWNESAPQVEPCTITLLIGRRKVSKNFVAKYGLFYIFRVHEGRFCRVTYV